DHGQAVVQPPGDVPVMLARIVVGAQHADVVPVGELPAQVQRVDFRAGSMPRQEVVNRVEDSHFTGGAARSSRNSEARIAVSSMSRSICWRCRDTITDRHKHTMVIALTASTSGTAPGFAMPATRAAAASRSARSDTARSALPRRIQRNEYSSVSLRRLISSN